MARRKRQASTFNLSFLDIMSCGFGAVVLVFLIIDHSMEVESRTINAKVFAEIDLLEEDIREGQAGLVRLRNAITSSDLNIVEAQGLATRVTEELDNYEALIASLEESGLSEDQDVDALKAEINRLEERVEKLKEAAEAEAGRSARQFLGDGNRQYLTGLNLGGKRIAILVDTSASMLGKSVPEILFARNGSAELRRSSPKWQQTVGTVEWLISQLPVNSKFQIIGFNDMATYFIEKSADSWLEASDRSQLDDVVEELQSISPEGGTNMEEGFKALFTLPYGPDNIFLITDGLPTLGPATDPMSGRATPRARKANYKSAVEILPPGVPVNTILMPMAGDPSAAWEFWELAQKTAGALITPTDDWP